MADDAAHQAAAHAAELEAARQGHHSEVAAVNASLAATHAAELEAKTGPNRYCSTRRMTPFDSTHEGSRCVSMTWRAISTGP